MSDDPAKANAILHALIANREAEIERLRAALKEIQDNGYRAALCHAVAKTALEQKSPPEAREAEFIGEQDLARQLRKQLSEARAAIGKALNQSLTDCADSGQSPREFVKTEEFKGTS
jgi:hypothetical protein